MRRREFVLCVPAVALAAPGAVFAEARPVWLAGLRRERNVLAGFRLKFEATRKDRVLLRLAVAPVYRFYVDGQFGGYGPARAAHGFCRVDEWNLTGMARDDRNCVCIEVPGYNVNSYYLPDELPFVQAEVIVNGKMAASTGKYPRRLEAARLMKRVRKVQRYSFQRPFSEIYRMDAGTNDWLRNAPLPDGEIAIEQVEGKKLLPRRVPYPDFTVRAAEATVAAGIWRKGETPAKYWKDRSLTGVGAQLGGYAETELTDIPSLRLQEIVCEHQVSAPGQTLAPNSYRIYDFGVNRTGFAGAKVRSQTGARVYFVFDELLTAADDVDFKRLDCVNAVVWNLSPGIHTLETFEPYTMRYLKLMVEGGQVTLDHLYLREYANGAAWRDEFASSDPGLNRIFNAARETYRQNAVDLFTDCPSRERAGWLCDSFFTARAALMLNGHTKVEEAFLENFSLPASFANLPAGMLPMCYPADHNDGVFIPNWALWLVLQLEEYLGRSGDGAMVADFRGKIEALFGYFEKFRNESGLLERLDGWIFVEWSDANRFVLDVSYPTNLLYAGALDAAGRIYQREDWRREARRLRAEVRRQSFDGTWFVDNAVRREGKLERTSNRSEVCQYFAFFFGAADRQRDAVVWQKLMEMGAEARAELRPANAFVGNLLRLELLSQSGAARQVLDETRKFYLKMAELTGTLWENDTPTASCNHGFSSYAAVLLYRDALGVRTIDPLRRIVEVEDPDNGLESCSGSFPVPGGRVWVEWKRKHGRAKPQVHASGGWKVRVVPRGMRPVDERG